MASEPLSRDELATRYLELLSYEPYPVQEEALLAWFSCEQGVLVCAPTGTGKTLIAEAAVFEALHAGKTAYYTTPLIALTEQKFRDMQKLAVDWGFEATNVGLVTGNRRENPDARILVVVAEILFNRLLHPEAFDFAEVATVVMDEFHSFNDRERGTVWEFTLGLLPEHVRTLLLSATVGNAVEFVGWLRKHHNRRLELIQSHDRKVPLVFEWIPDRLLTEQLEEMARGDEDARRTPALVFCFNREDCWTVGEQIKGKKVLSGDQQKEIVQALEAYDFSTGAGPKLRQLLLRGVGVHHAGVLPKYRRIVEALFEQKLLSIATCTETLSAGINLPARSVVLPSILKGPLGQKRVLEPSNAHQIFGRAGRPQYDARGYVFVLAHEDDVRIARWRVKYDQIPEDTKDPGLRKAKKQLKKKMPKRRTNEQYWTEEQYNKLQAAPPSKLQSRAHLPWRLLAYILDASPDVEIIRHLVSRRLLPPKRLEAAQKELDRMLLTLWRGGYVTLEPEPPKSDVGATAESEEGRDKSEPTPQFGAGVFDALLPGSERKENPQEADAAKGPDEYRPSQAHPTPELEKLLKFRGINPLYGVFLVSQLGLANREERVQALESALELPRSIGRFVRVPGHEELPPGPLATGRLDEQLLRLGLATVDQLTASAWEEEEDRSRMLPHERPRILTLAEKLRLVFDYDFPGVHDLRTWPVWAAGEVLQFAGDFNKYVTSKGLQKQEGVVFRHLLRLILLVREFAQFAPPETSEAEWQADLEALAESLAETCRGVDPTSTEKALEDAESRASAP